MRAMTSNSGGSARRRRIGRRTMPSALAVAPGGLLAVVDDALGSVAGTNLQVLARQRNFSCGVA
jgi:hypothetical protein